MEMTTPVYTRKVESIGEKMDMTTPVITRRVCWFVHYTVNKIVLQFGKRLKLSLMFSFALCISVC